MALNPKAFEEVKRIFTAFLENKELRKTQWKVVRVWEHEILDSEKVAKLVSTVLKSR